MELKITTEQMLKILYVLSWIIFVGVCIEAGSFLFNAFYTLIINPVDAKYFDLSELYNYDAGHFFVEVLFMNIVAVVRAFLFYLIVKILHDKKLNMATAFQQRGRKFYFQRILPVFRDWLVLFLGSKIYRVVGKSGGENARHTKFAFGRG